MQALQYMLKFVWEEYVSILKVNTWFLKLILCWIVKTDKVTFEKQYILNTQTIVEIKQFAWLVTVSRKQKSAQGQQETF